VAHTQERRIDARQDWGIQLSFRARSELAAERPPEWALGRAPLRLRRRSAFTLGVAAFIFLASSRLPRFDRLDRGRRVAIQHHQPSDARRIGHELRGIRRASLKDVAGADASSSDKSTNVTSDRVLEAFHVLNARVGKRRRHVTGRVATFPVGRSRGRIVRQLGRPAHGGTGSDSW
jgi:hypothetical protein